jgi:predicted nucleotidyltransferase
MIRSTNGWRFDVKSATLSPLFRSESQARLLAELFNHGGEIEFGALWREAGVKQPTASREVQQLEDAGVVTTRAIGRTKMVSVNHDLPYLAELRRIVDGTVGVLAIARNIYRDIQDIDEVWLYGSWAARHRGERGPAPRDVDIAVITATPGRGRLDADLLDAAETLHQRTRLPVDQKLYSTDSEFVETVIRPTGLKVR